jgi:hypothetical protein
MTTSYERRPASTELTGGAGFTYEDTVVAYYLTQLLRRERASGQSGFVKSVAVQRQGFGHPMDDLIVEFDDQDTRRTLDIQIKRSVTISSAASNEEFRGIISDAVKTQALATFTKGLDKCGFVVEHVTTETFRNFVRLIDWATSSTTGAEFETRFTVQGNAGKDEQSLRTALRPLLGDPSSDDEVSFYQHFAALNFNGLGEGGALRAEIISRLQGIIVSNEDGQDILLFDRLCRIAREGSATVKKWDRASLIGQLRGTVRLNVIPFLKDDIARLTTSAQAVLANMPEISSATGTGSWSAMTSLATRQALNWALQKSAAWPMHAESSSTCTRPTRARSPKKRCTTSRPFMKLNERHASWNRVSGSEYGRKRQRRSSTHFIPG